MALSASPSPETRRSSSQRPARARPVRMASSEAIRRFRHRSDFARVRDVYRHLNPWTDSFRPAALYRDAFATRGEHPLPAPEPCPDTTLAAVAQLCALRMRARTCLVTLVCRQFEYVLADMTQTAPFQQSVGNAPDVGTWVGTSSFNYRQGMTAEALDKWCTARRIREEPIDELFHYTEGLSAHWFIVSDVRSNPRFQHLAFVQNGSWIRFYCSLPLRSAQGSVIGSLTILDDQPRYGVSSSEMALMEDLSDTLVQHLDATAVRLQRQRGERFLQSLTLFNTGRHSMRNWWQSQDDSRVLNMGRNVAKGTAEERQGRLDTQFGVEQSLDQDETLFRNTGTTVRPTSPGNRKYMSPATYRRRTNRKSMERQTDDAFDLANSSLKAYNRASNLLREALGADGVVVVNASATTASSKREDSSGDSDIVPTAGSTDPELSMDEIVGRDDAVQFSELLSFSTRTKSSILGHRNPPGLFNLSVPYLQRLIRRYPRGSIFHFDRERSTFVPSTDDSSQSSADDTKKEKQHRKRDEKMLGDIVKGANTVSFYPLVDDGNDRWRSCIFVWNMAEEKYFDKSEDLPYLRTFGHCLVAELLRLESMAADHAKGTFISSISHELRSPLHGILAATEFLDGTELNAFQLEMAHAIGTAGKTLLDTVNHILDHSKISSFMRASKTRTEPNRSMRYGSLPGASDHPDDVHVVDLALLTEEVVETCVTSHRSHARPHGALSISYASVSDAHDWRRSHKPNTSGDVISEVSVTLNISKRKDWTVEMQPGAWTRIITNLVGNALKYTQKGHISIRLNVLGDPVQPVAGETTRLPIELIVEDTGIGISQQFLEQDLFTPFKQEDPHFTGTGLGLSIVKQIAQDVGAQLDFRSKQSEGTRISLRLMVTVGDGSSSPTESPTRQSATQWPDNLQVDSFHLLPAPSIETSGQETSPDHLDVVGSSVAANAREWLGCAVSIAADDTDPRTTGPSVCAITERNLAAWSSADLAGLAAMLKEAAVQHSHILILAGSMQSVSLPESLRPNLPLEGVFVHQPVGPRKLLRAITSDRDSVTSGQSPEPFDELGVPLRHSRRPSVPLNTAAAAGSHRRSGSSQVVANDISAGLQRASLNPTLSNDPASSTLPQWSSIPPSITTTTPTTASGDDTAASSSLTFKTPDTNRIADTVLLVEDNDLNMRILVALMEKLDRPYHCVANGREAVNAYRQSSDSFFLVLMDMSMPVMDGFQATAKFRETEQKHKLKPVYICALTGVTSEDARARAFSCGVDEFFSKPVRIKELQTLLEKVERESAGSAVGES